MELQVGWPFFVLTTYPFAYMYPWTSKLDRTLPRELAPLRFDPEPIRPYADSGTSMFWGSRIPYKHCYSNSRFGACYWFWAVIEAPGT